MPRITNWLEVERRLANYNTAIKTIETSLVRTNNSRNIMLHALLINLKDLLESQSEISLWFYDIDEPTKYNLPYTSWSTPSDHYGDIFYSRTKGVIYQFKTNGEWERLNDATLLNSMALTNSKLESGDHERQVFTTEPTPPYESGDWWIQNDGTLFICQIGRQTGTRQPNDFINSLDYAEAIAKATDNILEVLKGTVIQTTDNAVTYLDKATNTTTTISGNSIKTGELISNNYLSGVRGTRISLDDGTIDTKYFQLSSTGQITSIGGTIGGLTINNGYLCTNNKTSLTSSNDGIYISSDGIALGANSAFKVTNTGALTTSNATITGGSISLYGGTESAPKFAIYSSSDSSTKIIITPTVIQAYRNGTTCLQYISSSSGKGLINLPHNGEITIFGSSGNTFLNGNKIETPSLTVSGTGTFNSISVSGSVSFNSISISGSSSFSSISVSGNMTINSGNTIDCYRNLNMHSYNISNAYIRNRWPITNASTITIDYFNFVNSSSTYLEMMTANYGAYGINVWGSDRRLKDNIENTTENALDVINKIQHRQFDWKESKVHENIGYIAQELEEINEKFVLKVPQRDSDGNVTDERYQINETKIIPYLSKAIQELYQEINEVKEVLYGKANNS